MHNKVTVGGHVLVSESVCGFSERAARVARGQRCFVGLPVKCHMQMGRFPDFVSVCTCGSQAVPAHQARARAHTHTHAKSPYPPLHNARAGREYWPATPSRSPRPLWSAPAPHARGHDGSHQTSPGSSICHRAPLAQCCTCHFTRGAAETWRNGGLAANQVAASPKE